MLPSLVLRRHIDGLDRQSAALRLSQYPTPTFLRRRWVQNQRIPPWRRARSLNLLIQRTHASNYLLCDMLPSWSSVVIYRGGNNKQSAAALRLSQYPTPFANIPSPTLDTGPRWGGSIYFTLKYGAGPNPKLLPWNDKVINDHNKQTDRHTSTLLVALAS